MRTLLEQYPTAGTMDRINAILRPTEFTNRRGVYVRLLECLEGLPTHEERVTAFAYAAFDAYAFAYFSGPETHSSAYPGDDDPRMQSLSEDREAQIDAAVQELLAECRSTPTTLAHVADRLWVFIASLQMIPERVLALAVAVRACAVREVRCDVATEQPPSEAAPYHAALWKHRHTIRECAWVLFHACDEGALQSKPDIGRHLLALLAEIHDAEERACVLAFLAQRIAEYGHVQGRKSLFTQPDPLLATPQGRRS